MRAGCGIAVLVLGTMLGVGCKADIPSSKTREVKGRVVRATESKIVVAIGVEQWEVAVTPSTEIASDLKEGQLVTIDYALVAKRVRVIPEVPTPVAPRTAPRTPRPGMRPTEQT
ncbi:MAG: hypothetical protein KA072_09510 [Thermoanaerobaculaceae bacterium]|nr:hypothetical protein [Thermoanaerobaculaceae bacterium]MDI9621032.1 hypothetical protein [Acidobacteriota bacterium]NLH11020.1 hypothetical protein [Holophagae bacterium]HPW55853.1 hypothetical protein [Thermoanaerobaculaceae bacterium]